MANCYLFIDDSGTKEFTDKDVKQFCYAGVLLNQAKFDEIDGLISSLKKSYFPGNVEVKSHWLRRPEKRKQHYLDPYGITEKKLTSFVESFISLLTGDLKSWIRVIGVVIDKPRLYEKYSQQHFYPSAVAYEFLMQRVANFCHQYGIGKVRVFFDDMSGKSPKGNDWKKLLVEQHKSLIEGRSAFYRTWNGRQGMNYSHLDNRLTFLDSKDSNLIQTADICAYDIMRQARDSWNNFDDEPLYKGYKNIMPIMHKNQKTGKIKDFGGVCFPR